MTNTTSSGCTALATSCISSNRALSCLCRPDVSTMMISILHAQQQHRAREVRQCSWEWGRCKEGSPPLISSGGDQRATLHLYGVGR